MADQFVQQALGLGCTLPFVAVASLLVLGASAMRKVAMHIFLSLLAGFSLTGLLQHLLLISFWYVPALSLLIALVGSRHTGFFSALGVVALGFGGSYLAGLLAFAMFAGMD